MHISSLFLKFDAILCFFYTQNTHFTEKNTIFVHENWLKSIANNKGRFVNIVFYY
jgi:hypothetical protein